MVKKIILIFLKIPFKYPGLILIILTLALGSYITINAYLSSGIVRVDEIMRRINLNLDNGAHVEFRLNAPNSKPIIKNQKDYEIMEYDHQYSTLEVDGVVKKLHEGTFNYSVDRRGKKIFYTVSFPFEKDASAYVLLEEVVSFPSSKEVKVEYYFIFKREADSNYQVKEVKLTLAHLPLVGFPTLDIKNDKVSGTSLVNLRKASGVGKDYLPFAVTFGGGLVEAKKVEIFGKEGFETNFKILNPQTYKREFIGAETVLIK